MIMHGPTGGTGALVGNGSLGVAPLLQPVHRHIHHVDALPTTPQLLSASGGYGASSNSARPRSHGATHAGRFTSLCVVCGLIVVSVCVAATLWWMLPSWETVLAKGTRTTADLNVGGAAQMPPSIRSGTSPSTARDRLASDRHSPPLIKEGTYRGGAAWRSSKTVDAVPLIETPWIRVEDHTVSVRAPTGDLQLVKHWKWVDVADQVNVLVSVSGDVLVKIAAMRRGVLQTIPEDLISSVSSGSKYRSDEEFFLMFEQEKYGYEGTSFAVVGGMIERDDASPTAAAQREIKEEMGLVDCAMQPLGKYRTDVNRGGGFVNLFLARNCDTDVRELQKEQQQRANSDLERQKLVAFSRKELRRAALSVSRGGNEQIKEVKWCSTVALGLLHLEAES